MNVNITGHLVNVNITCTHNHPNQMQVGLLFTLRIIWIILNKVMTFVNWMIVLKQSR